MNAIQKIVKNIGFNGLAKIFTAFIAFFFMIYLARFLGETEFGRFNFALSFTSLMIIIIDLGVNEVLIREISRKKELSEDYTNQAFLMKIPLSVLTFFIIVCITYFLDYSQDMVWLIYLLGIYNIFQIFAFNYLALFQAWEKMEYVALFQIVEKVIIASLGIFVLLKGYGVLEVGIVYLVTGVLELSIFMLLSFKKLIKPRFKFRFNLQLELLKKGLPFGLNSIFDMLLFKIDTILLGLIIGNFAVGVYNAAYNPLLSLSMIFGGMFATAIYPVMSRQFKDSKNILNSSLQISTKYLAIIGFPIALGCIVLAEKFIQLFYGGEFLDSIIAFQILALFIPLRLISTINGTFLSSINKQPVRTLSTSLTILFNISVNIIIIPIYSFIGASIATLASEILLFWLLIFFIKRYYGSVINKKVILKAVVSAIIMSGFLYFMKDLNLAINISIGILIYFIILIILKTFDEQDKKLFKSLIEWKS